MSPIHTALLISPHLDDVAFSCGGLAALLADKGWHTILATVFTRSIIPTEGFALACQLDKGLSADADYMALRRSEDLDAAARLGVGAMHWMDLPEAPHRGYSCAPDLFASVRADDGIGADVIHALRALRDAHAPDLVIAPQSLGGHVDHQVVTACVLATFAPERIAWYRDMPYAIRNPDAEPIGLPRDLPRQVIGIDAGLNRKIAASACYVTQIGFQFGDASRLAQALTAFACEEGAGNPAEVFRGCALPV